MRLVLTDRVGVSVVAAITAEEGVRVMRVGYLVVVTGGRWTGAVDGDTDGNIVSTAVSGVSVSVPLPVLAGIVSLAVLLNG